MAGGIRLTVTSTGHAIDAAVNRLGDLSRPLGQIGQFGLRQSRERLRNRIQHPTRSTGHLLKSGHSDVSDSAATVGFSAIYARIQQLGGVVTPKGHPYLSIPVPDWLAKQGKWPREWPRGSLKYVRRAQINLFGSTWYGPALVANNESLAERRDTAKGRTLRKHTLRSKRDRKKYGKLTAATKELKRLGMAEAEASVRGRKAGVGKAKFGEVLYALVKRVSIPADPYLEWDTKWAQFTHETLAKHLGMK